MILSNKNAYILDNGDVIFDTASYTRYGVLSRQLLDQLRAGVRVSITCAKRNPTDFVLWKKSSANEPAWPSPWGRGRPGWHIECSAMNHKEFGTHFDIHGGGSDLLFPHHENEIAQSICAHGEPYVNYWMHSGMVMIDQEKMSKSSGKFLTIRSLLKRYDAETIRYFFISTHYRSHLNYSIRNLDNAYLGLRRLYSALYNTCREKTVSRNGDYSQKFTLAMNDDFNTPEACAVFFEMAREINRLKKTDKTAAEELAIELRQLANILGLLKYNPTSFLQRNNRIDDNTVVEIEKLISDRNEAREAKDWMRADRIREQLNRLGAIPEDGQKQTTWRCIHLKLESEEQIS
jgi:cysteinyl-tRNA synthetase